MAAAFVAEGCCLVLRRSRPLAQALCRVVAEQRPAHAYDVVFELWEKSLAHRASGQGIGLLLVLCGELSGGLA